MDRAPKFKMGHVT